MKKRYWTFLILLIFLMGCAPQRRPAPTLSKERKFFTPPNWQQPIQTPSRDKAVAATQHTPAVKREVPVMKAPIPVVTSKQKPVSRSIQNETNGFHPDFTQKPVKAVVERPPRIVANNDGFKPEFASAAEATSASGNYKPNRAETREQMIGYASWYGPGFHGKRTANGERYNQNQMTAAHKILPMNTWVQVHNLENNRVAVVRINDRGPYKKNRIIDLTKKAADTLGFKDKGTAHVKLKVLQYPKDYDHSKGLDPYKQVVVQIAVFKGEQRAYNFRKQLSRRYQHIPFQIDNNKKPVFHVIAGPYEKRAKALEIAKALKADGIDNFVRSYRK